MNIDLRHYLKNSLAFITIFFLAITAVQLVGCATKTADFKLNEPGPEFSDLDGMSRIVVVRPKPFGKIPQIAGGCGISVNGTMLGRISSEDYVEALIEPGVATVETVGTEKNQTLTFGIEENQTVYISAEFEYGKAFYWSSLHFIDAAAGAALKAKYEKQNETPAE